MKANETLIELINIGIVHCIGEEYYITGLAEELLKKDQQAQDLVIPTVSIDIDKLYPETIRKASLDNKLKAIYDYCDIPVVINNEGSKFMVRSNDGETRKRMLDVLKDSKYRPELLLECIKDYYTDIPYPKSFKRFLGEGDLFTLYDAYLKGEKIQSGVKPDNTHWAND